MSLESQQDRVNCIVAGTQHPFWTEYLLPLLQERCRGKLESLALKAAEDDDITRGWVQALRWIIRLPQSEIDAHQRAEEDARAENEADERANHRAELGFRSPIREAPAVGETTEAKTA